MAFKNEQSKYQNILIPVRNKNQPVLKACFSNKKINNPNNKNIAHNTKTCFNIINFMGEDS